MDSEIKEFNKGLNKDLNPRQIPNGVYIDAHNIRLLSDNSGKSLGINNVKGNLFNYTIPNTPVFQQISIIGNGLETLKLNTQFNAVQFDTTGLTYEALYKIIIENSAYTNCIQNLGHIDNPGSNYNVYYGDDYLVLFPDNTSTLVMVEFGGFLGLNSTYVNASSNPEIIGSTTIRDDIYLFVAANGGGDDKDSTAPTNSIGQIWKYTYDKINLTSSMQLIYNNYINFTTYFCIPPTAALGRYENGGIQRIYWTDNYNKLRSLNVANPQSLAIDPTILDIVPPVDFDIPILTNIENYTGPSIKVGAYQCAYRLKNTGGAVTNFSELSNIVFVCQGNPVPSNSVEWKEFTGGSVGSLDGNHITWTINNLDRNFDRIEVAIVFRETLTSTPIIYLLSDDIVQNNTYKFEYNGGLDTTLLSINEFLALSGLFTNCKTIATKDNRLFAANIRSEFNDIDFDCRAYRSKFSSLTTFDIINNSALENYDRTIPNIYKTIPEKADAINPNTSIDDSSTGYFYNQSGTLGGEGLNIFYEFCTIATSCDRSAVGTFEIDDFVPAPWRETNPNYITNFIDLGIDSPTNENGFTDQKYTTLFPPENLSRRGISGLKFTNENGLLKGYQRNEVYRFGIQFFDKSKNPLFVKWIGDIKTPDFWDINTNSIYEDGTNTGVNDFRLSFVANKVGYDECFTQQLGLHFIINNLETISNLVDGYSIVRVKREEKDKSVVCSGIIYRPLVAYSDGNVYMTSLQQDSSGNDLGNSDTLNGTSVNNRAYFTTPDICNGNLTSPAEGMNFTIKTLFQEVNTGNHSRGMGQNGEYIYWKYYNSLQLISPMTGKLTYVNRMVDGSTISNGVDTHNYDFDQVIVHPTHEHGNVDVGRSVGNSCYYFNFNHYIVYTELFARSPRGKYYCVIDRILSDQYGGNTYTQRSNSEYIKCSNYIPIRNSSIPIQSVFNCYGGDIFVNMYDSNRWCKNLGDTGRGQVPGSPLSGTFYYPVESSVNTELRQGTDSNHGYMNKDFNPSTTGQFHEQYLYNPIYSAEDSFKTYFPKPDPFINNKEYDNRFYASNIKINGELIDSWGLFNSTNYWDVEGVYGPINAIDILQDKLYFWQNRAFGLMEVNPRAVTTDVNNTSNPQLQLSTGLPLQRHDYISTEVGLQHQWGVTKSAYKLFWIDVANKKFFSYSPGSQINPESDIKGMFSFFNDNLVGNILTTDKPVYGNGYGVRAVYDFKYNQALFTFIDYNPNEDSDYSYTLTFDEYINAFTSFFDFKPKIYFTDGYKIFSTNFVNIRRLSDIYIHDSYLFNSYYGSLYPSTIKFAYNKSPLDTKVFDTLRWDSQVLDPSNNDANQFNKTWTSVRFYTDYQNSDYTGLIPSTNIKRKERTWKLPVFKNKVINNSNQSPDIFNPVNLSMTPKPFADRLRDKFLVVDLVYLPTDNFKMVTNNVICEFRKSSR